MFLTKLWARLSDLRSAEEVRDLRARRAMQAAELDLITAEAHVAIAQKKLEHRTKEWLNAHKLTDKTCPACNGTGDGMDATINCENCQGHGVVL